MNAYADDTNARRKAGVIMKMLACVMVLTAGLLAPARLALATNEVDNREDTEGTSDSNDPVILYNGAATEIATVVALESSKPSFAR